MRGGYCCACVYVACAPGPVGGSGYWVRASGWPRGLNGWPRAFNGRPRGLTSHWPWEPTPGASHDPTQPSPPNRNCQLRSNCILSISNCDPPPQKGNVYKGGGDILDNTHPSDFGPTQTSPPLIILWGAFLVSQTEAKAEAG